MPEWLQGMLLVVSLYIVFWMMWCAAEWSANVDRKLDELKRSMGDADRKIERIDNRVQHVEERQRII